MSPLVRLIVAAAAVLLLAAAPAAAVQPAGSAGWTTDGWTNFDGTVYSGPGPRYDTVGNVAGGIRIRVDRCTQRWCQFHTASVRGWISLDNVSFGQKPDGWFAGPKFPTQRGGAGSVCFYSGRNFTGASLCAGSGHLWDDLALIGFDNQISSVEVGPGVSALVCRDRNFRSYCEVVDVSKGHINGLLDNGVSSIRIY